MAADGDPRDVTEGMLKVAAAMFGQIKGEEARAQQCLALAEQARLKAIYEKASARREAIGMPDLMDAAYLEALAKQFGQIPGYKDAKQQAEQCLQDAENVRENAYNDAVKAMQEAERSSYKWREAIQKLAREGLNGYRDVEELRKQAEQRYEECRNAEEKERKAKERRKKTLTIAAVVLVVIACAIAWCIPNVIIPNNKYQQAVVLRENGQYDEAIALFTELGNYYDAAAQVTETKYQKATNLNAFGKYDEAYAIYVTLTGYKDVDKLLIEDDNIVAAKKVLEAREAQFTVGNYVTFGEYPQTTAGEDMTPIEWLVLARDGNKALLISRYGLDAQPYNTDHTSVTWETCTLRTWLNVTFYNKAFSSDEQAAILTTSVDNGKNQGYSKWSTSGGNNTEDKVFLLSYAEANKYFGVTYDNISNTKSRVAPTAYAIAQGAWASSSNKTADSTDAGWWWLRSPGFYQSSAAYVLGYGLFRGDDVIRVSGSVRPALWVNLESDVFSY